MKLTDHNTKTPTAVTGFFATLCGLLRVRGSGASKTDKGTGAPSARRLILAALATTLGALAFTAAPALAAAPETPETGKANPASITATTATLEDGVLNPHKALGELAEYEYRFRVSATECEGEGATAGMAAGALKEVVPPVELTNLQPNVEYTFCLFERSLATGETSAASMPVHFTTTPAPPSILGEGAQQVSSTSAVLQAGINPNSEPTKYRFEYSTSATGETLNLPVVTVAGAPPAAELEGFEGQFPTASTGAVLTPGTTYYYRVVAENAQSETEPKPAEGPVKSFTTVPAPTTAPVTAITGTTATFNGVLTPLNPTVATQYHFIYNIGGACTGGSETLEAEAGTGTGGAPAATPVIGLQPDTIYTVCFVTSNTNQGSGPVTGAPVTFRTLPDAYVTDVASSSATLHAVLNPEGSSTTYRFQYGPSSEYGSETPEAAVGSGSAAVSVEFHLQNLSVASVYHYRVIASNAATETFASEDHTFTTHPSGSEFSLPDGRQYELVSPPDKHAGSIGPMNEFGRVIQASEDGSKLTFTATDPITAEPAGNRGGLEPSQVLASRGPAGWADEEITTPNNDVGALRLGHEAEYEFFSSDLSFGVVQPPGETPLAPPVLPGETQERTLWLRDNATASFSALASAANAESKVGGTEAEEDGNSLNYPYFEDASPDLRHIVFHDVYPLVEGEGEGLFEWTDGTLQRVSVLPSNGGDVNGELGARGTADERAANRVSDNGSRVTWTYGKHLYLRDMQRKETVQLDEPEPGCNTCNAEGAPKFMTASADGSKVFFTDESPLTENSSAIRSGDSAADLYVFEETEASRDGGPLAGKLTDLTLDPNFDAAKAEGERAAVLEAIGASDDGSYVYFVANGLLGDAVAHGATPGDCRYAGGLRETCNLYLGHFDGSGWEAPQFIATLSAIDSPDWTAKGGSKHLTARVSPDGRWLAFMSDRPLTGYDNTDANSGAADEEVYLFDQAHGRLVCASCNPSGQRPEGVFDPVEEEPGYHKLLVDEPASWEGRWLAGSVPGWTTYHVFEAVYQSRYLSNNGRLFFNSPDALVPADVDHQQNVYEFEPQGVGGCTPATVDASDLYEPATDGCVALISSGTSRQESAFLDASATGGRDSEADEGGGDVFFLTTSQLAPQDLDQAYDIYDTHECSAGSPCVLQAAAAVPPACNNEASCKAAPETQPSIYGLPSSATFTGESNFAPAAPPPPVKTATKKPVKCKKVGNGSRRHEKSRCIKKPNKKKNKARKSAHANRRASR